MDVLPPWNQTSLRKPIHTSSPLGMCYNVIDGRTHKSCGHFVALDTRRQDCLRPDCLFSRRHMHVGQCRSASCIRLMSPPALNPIRESPTRCPQCVMVARVGYP